MWAVAAITGPLLGALFVSTVGWRWIFGINLPIGVAAALLLRGYHERREQRARGGLDLPEGQLKAEANEWSITRGSRSGRVAWQFIQDLAGRLGKPIN